MSTLQFASRAKMIMNEAQQNFRLHRVELSAQFCKQLEKVRSEACQKRVIYRWQIAGLKAALFSTRRKRQTEKESADCRFEVSEDFKNKLLQLKLETEVAESRANAMASPHVACFSLSAIVVASVDDFSNLKR